MYTRLKISTTTTIIAALFIRACGNPDGARFLGPEGSAVVLVLDAPAARSLITEETAKQVATEVPRSPDVIEILPPRELFGRRFSALQSVPVAAGTKAKILETTSCRCGKHSHITASLVKVIVAEGSFKNVTGWVCRTFIGTEAQL